MSEPQRKPLVFGRGRYFAIALITLYAIVGSIAILIEGDDFDKATKDTAWHVVRCAILVIFVLILGYGVDRLHRRFPNMAKRAGGPITLALIMLVLFGLAGWFIWAEFDL